MASEKYRPDRLAAERLKITLTRNKMEAQQEAQRQQQDAMLYLRQRADEAKLAQVDAKAADLDALGKFRDAEKKRMMKEAQDKAKLKEGGGKAKAPTLSPPTPINTENPQAGMAQSPFGMENFGQPGGPQPGSPMQGGGMQGADATGNVMPGNAQQLMAGAGQLAPFLQQQTTRQGMSLEETMPGTKQFIPRTETTTRTAPNVLSAYSAARIQLGLAESRQRSYDTYMGDLAQVALRAGQDPVADQVTTREVMRMLRSGDTQGIEVLQRKVAAAQAARLGKSEFAPRTIADPTSRTGRRIVPGLDALGREAPAGMGSEIAGGLAQLGQGLGHILTKDQTNKVQEDIRLAGNAMANLRVVNRFYDPAFLQLPETTLIKAGNVMEWLDEGAVDAPTKAKLQQFASFRTSVLAAKAEYRKAMSGLAVNAVEMKSIDDTMPGEKDNISSFIGKYTAMQYMLAMSIARNNHYLRMGLMGEDSVAAAIGKEPKMQFSFSPGKVSQGEVEMSRLAMQREEEAVARLQAMAKQAGGPINDAFIRQQAINETAQHFGLDPDAYEQYLRVGP